MSVNEFVPFATAPGANVILQEDYLTDPAQQTGFTVGLLYSAKTNKVWRQSSFVAASLAHLMWTTLDEDINDDGDMGTFVEQLKETLWRVVTGYDPLGEAPKDGQAYGRRDAKWVTVLNRAGDHMNGELILAKFPYQAMEAVNKQYVDNLVAGLAPIFSPVFTGIPRTPTPPHDAIDNRIVNCAWVRLIVGDLVTGVSYVEAGRGLDGGGQGHVVLWVKDYGITNGMLAYMAARSVKANIAYSDAPAADISFANFIAELGLAPIDSPHFVGIPTVPDAGDNISNQIASTAWVNGRYLPLIGGQLYRPGGDGLLSLRVEGGHDNWMWFWGENSYTIGVAKRASGGFFGVYSNDYGRWNWTTYPSGLFHVNTGMLWATGNPPGDFVGNQMASGTVIVEALSLVFNCYWGGNYNSWTHINDGYAGVLGFYDNRYIFYTSWNWLGSRQRANHRHSATIEWNRIRVVGDNSPSFYATNVSGGGPFGWSNSAGNMSFGRTNDNGDIDWQFAYFAGGDGSWVTWGRQHARGGLSVYGNDPIYIEGNQENARIYFANAGRVWLAGTRRDNGHWTLQDVSGGYVEKFRVQTDGNVWCQSGMYADGGFYTGGNCNLGSTWVYGGFWARDSSRFNSRLDVNGYCWVGDLFSNGNLYAPNGWLTVGGSITCAGGFTLGGSGQINGGCGVHNGMTIFGNGNLVCQNFSYHQGGGQFYKVNDPLHIGENGTGNWSRIHYWSGGKHWTVGGATDGSFQFNNEGGGRGITYFNQNGDWMFYYSITANGGYYGTVHLAAAHELDALEDAPPGALQIVNAVRPTVHRDATKFRDIVDRLERRPEYLDPDFVRRSRGLRLDELVAAMGEGFYVRQDRGKGPQTVSYMELIAVLWQSVQELSAKLEERVQ